MNKEALCLNGVEIVDVFYKNDKVLEMAPLKYLPDKYAELIDFFNVQPPKIKINYIYSRNEMDELWGSKSRVYTMVDNNDPYQIYIFSPLVPEEVTNHRADDILPIVIHEIAHTFVTELNGRCFSWVNEGLCELVSGFVYDKKVEKQNWEWFRSNGVFIDTEISWDDLIERQGYDISSRLVKYINERCGKDAVFNLLKINRVPDKGMKEKIDVILNCDFEIILDDFGQGVLGL